MNKTLFALAMVAFLVAPATASATECGDEATLDIAGTFYVDDRGDPVGTGLLTGGGTWLFMESNGESGLQRGDTNSPIPGSADADYAHCSDNPDTVIF